MAQAVIFDPGYRVIKMEPHTSAGVSDATADIEAIFEETFIAHFKGLHSYALTIVKDEDTAEEMVQNVFFKLWEKKESIRVQQSLSSYLYRAVYNESLNYIRHTKVRLAYQADALKTSDETDYAQTEAKTREMERKIQVALNELPEQCRTIFQMSRFEDMKYREIADKMGLSIKTVENQMGKALKLMRIKLAEFLPLLGGVLLTNLKNWI